MKLYAEIAKTEDQDDGTIKVWGWASSGAVDSDGEVITPEAMKAALPDYMRFGAVREMHQPKAAGTAIEAEVNDEGKTWFGAHVVDSEAVKKVKAGVYKGFSIGGKVTERDDMNKSVIKGIKLVEVSLVDRPANPEAVFTMYKAERTPEDDVSELAAMLDAGTVTPARLIELAKADVVAATTATEEVATQPEQAQEQPAEEAAAKADDAPDLAKYGSEVMDAAIALQALDAICYLMAREMAEGHDEPPEQVAQLKAVVANLKAFIASEIQEEEPEDKEMADGADDLEKKGARFSAATRAVLTKAYGCMKDAVTHLDGMKWDGDDGEKADETADLAKSQADTITKLHADIDALKAEIDALKKQPMPGKALLKAITVAKSDDSNLITKTDEPDPASMLKGEALALHQLKTMYRAAARR